MTDKSTFKERFKKIQAELKVPKNQLNKFGGYKYRNNEDILEALKPLLNKYNMIVTQNDEIVQVGTRYYVKANSRIEDVESDAYKECCAFAREPEQKKGMDESQISGASSSYARKYSLNGLFGIDDTKDADNQKPQETVSQPKSHEKRIDDITAQFVTPEQWVQKLIELKKNKNFTREAENYYNKKMAEFNKFYTEVQEFERDANNNLGH
jgi:hypothetical protein